jgi:hypothetical protein
MEDESDDSEEEVEEVFECSLPPLGCFFGDAATNGSDPIRASTSTLLQIISAYFKACLMRLETIECEI